MLSGCFTFIWILFEDFIIVVVSVFDLSIALYRQVVYFVLLTICNRPVQVKICGSLQLVSAPHWKGTT